MNMFMCNMIKIKHDFLEAIYFKPDRDSIHVSDTSNFQNLPMVTSTFDSEQSNPSKLTSVTTVVWFRLSRLSVPILSKSPQVGDSLWFILLLGFGFVSSNPPRCFWAPVGFKLSDLHCYPEQNVVPVVAPLHPQNHNQDSVPVVSLQCLKMTHRHSVWAVKNFEDLDSTGIHDLFLVLA